MAGPRVEGGWMMGRAQAWILLFLSLVSVGVPSSQILQEEYASMLRKEVARGSSLSGECKAGILSPEVGKEWTASYLLVEWHTCAPEDDSVHEVLAIQSCCSRQRAVGTTSVTNGTGSAARQLNRSHNSGATLHRRPGDDARGARVRTLHHLWHPQWCPCCPGRLNP